MDCGCGRSPTGKCVGWHSLSDDECKKKLKDYEEKEGQAKEEYSRND